jgi:hypothetical protein
MKKIVTKVPELKITLLDELSRNSPIGIKWGTSKSMAVETIDEDNNLRYQSLDNAYITPNLLNTWNAPTVKEYVERCLNQGGHVEAYEFSNIKELFKWMSE